MAMTFSDQTALAKFNQCRQQASALDGDVTEEDFVRFADYAWHLRDWVQADQGIPTAAKLEVLRWKESPPCIELWVCRDAINTDKHMVITKYEPIGEDLISNSGFGIGRWGKGGYGEGEKQITITMKDGTSFNALDVVQAVLACWEDFFARHRIGSV